MKKIILNFAILIAAFVVSASAADAQKLDRSKKPGAGPQPKVQIGKIESFQLDNGLKVFIVENHKLPKVSFSLQFNIDPIIEGNKKGYTDMMASLMGTATKNRTKDQLNEELDFIGGTLEASSEGIYASALKKHQAKILDLMSDVLLNPVFTQGELDKIKTQILSGLAASKNTPESMAANIASVLNFGKGHPYGEIITEQTVANITLEDCKKYYDTYFKPNVAYLAIVGDITIEEAKAAAQKHFGNWQKGNVPKSTVPAVAYPQSTMVAYVPRPNSVQSSVRVTYPIDLKMNNPDALKVRVLSEILGGGASARLFRNLRETYNLTYGAYSHVAPDEFVGSFEAYAEVRTSGTDSSVTQFMKEIIKIKAEKVTEDELRGVINNMTGKFAISLEDPATVARFAINIDRHNLPKDYYETYLSRLAAITVDDIHAVAQKYIQPENAWIVVVGDRTKTKDLLENWKGKIKFFDQYGNDFVETRPAPADMNAEKVIEKYINAIGGAANIMKVKTMVMKMSTAMQGVTIEITTKKMNPKKKGLTKYTETVVVNGTMVVQKKIFDGAKGYQSSPMGGANVEGEELEAMKMEAEPHNELRYKELGYKLVLVGIDVVNEKDAYKVEITNPKGKVETHYYDVETGLLVKTESITESAEGDAQVVTLLSEYKEVGGVKFAHRMQIEAGPQSMDLKVTSVVVNGKIDSKEFVIPKP